MAWPLSSASILAHAQVAEKEVFPNSVLFTMTLHHSPHPAASVQTLVFEPVCHVCA